MTSVYRISTNGTSCRLCNYALFAVPDVKGEQAAGIKMLLEAQANILSQDAALAVDRCL